MSKDPKQERTVIDLESLISKRADEVRRDASNILLDEMNSLGSSYKSPFLKSCKLKNVLGDLECVTVYNNRVPLCAVLSAICEAYGKACAEAARPQIETLIIRRLTE